MKKNYLLLTATLALFFISCDLNKESNDESSVPAANPVTTPAAAPAAATNTVQPAANPQSAPVTSQTTTATAPANSNIAPVQFNAPPSGVVLNPAHGQPGHDCSIPVGQPLKNQVAGSSPQITTTNSVPQQAPVTTTAPAQSILPGNNSTVKLNPAHGQPGHRCDIPVGKPLN